MKKTLHIHTKDIIKLSLPLIATQIGHIITAIVDNIFLGQLSKTEQAAGILSNNLFILILVFSIGMSYALTPLTTEIHVENNDKEKAVLFKNGIVLNLLVGLLLFIVLFFLSPLLHYMQQPEQVVKLAIPFFNVLIFSIIPVSLFFSCKQYCEGLSNTRAAMYFSILGNLLNIILNYGLIYGKYGLPELGYMGSCWATFISRVVMGIGFYIYMFRNPSVNSFRVFYKEARLSLQKILSIFKMGLGFALQFTFEVAAFAIAGFMAGTFGEEQIDAHGIALNLAAFTYMFASGISGAATILVSNYVSRQDEENLYLSIKSSFRLVISIMLTMALIFLILHQQLPLLFSKEPNIIHMASNLLLFAAMFQLFDGTQVTALGILRGMEDVKFPTYITFIGYWIIALPLAYIFGFILNLQVYGVWLSLSIALLFVALALYLRIKYLMKQRIQS